MTNLEKYRRVIDFIEKNEALNEFDIANINESKCTLIHANKNYKVVLDSRTLKVLEEKKIYEKDTTIGLLLKSIK